MKTSSKKAKGRALQNWVVKQLNKCFGSDLEEGDIKGAIMGETGSDIKMSPKAKKIIPFKFECKNQEKYKSIYNAYEQVDLNKEIGESILVIKSNRKEPLAILNAETLFSLLEKQKQLENYSDFLSKFP